EASGLDHARDRPGPEKGLSALPETSSCFIDIDEAVRDGMLDGLDVAALELPLCGGMLQRLQPFVTNEFTDGGGWKAELLGHLARHQRCFGAARLAPPSRGRRVRLRQEIREIDGLDLRATEQVRHAGVDAGP